MDFQPANLFIRGVSLGPLVKLAKPMTFFKYLNIRYHRAIVEDASRASLLPPPQYVTNYRYYEPLEVLRALALPERPTHVLELDLVTGTELQGPAFINPLSPYSVTSLRSEHRFGNGIEFWILTPLSTCLANSGRVTALA